MVSTENGTVESSSIFVTFNTFRSAYGTFDTNVTSTGKKSPGIDDGQLNSIEPAGFDASTMDTFHVRRFLPLS